LSFLFLKNGIFNIKSCHVTADTEFNPEDTILQVLNAKAIQQKVDHSIHTKLANLRDAENRQAMKSPKRPFVLDKNSKTNCGAI